MKGRFVKWEWGYRGCKRDVCFLKQLLVANVRVNEVESAGCFEVVLSRGWLMKDYAQLCTVTTCQSSVSKVSCTAGINQDVWTCEATSLLFT